MVDSIVVWLSTRSVWWVSLSFLFSFFFFTLGGSCGCYFLWLLLVVGLVVFLMGFGGCFNGFGGWHDGGYCGCGGGCWPATWWVCYLAVLVSFFSWW